jgi:hypothetical protein
MTYDKTKPFPEPLDPDVAALVRELDENLLEYFQERAGIAEFEAGMSRADAEQFAWALTQARFNLQK